MAWERRGKASYFYKSVRDGDTVKKIYLGRGLRAAVAAHVAGTIGAHRRIESKALIALQTQLEPLDAAMDDLDAGVDDLVATFMTASGMYNHHGQWRIKHG